jgi:hypothetical protein
LRELKHRLRQSALSRRPNPRKQGLQRTSTLAANLHVS